MTTGRNRQDDQSLGARLRQARLRAGLTGTKLGIKLGCHQSKVSRLELGEQIPTEEDLFAFLNAVGASDLREEFLELLRAARAQRSMWNDRLQSGQASIQRDAARRGARAKVIRSLEICLVPGLLQTPDYARYRLLENVDLYGTDPAEVPIALQARIARQDILYDLGKRLHFLIMESVLTNLLCPVEVLKGQLDRLLTVLTFEHITLSIVPRGIRLPAIPLHGFSIYDGVVYVETLDSGHTVTAEKDVNRYNKVFDALSAISLTGEEARRLIVRTAEDLR